MWPTVTRGNVSLLRMAIGANPLRLRVSLVHLDFHRHILVLEVAGFI
jgi:hypothetical protein